MLLNLLFRDSFNYLVGVFSSTSVNLGLGSIFTGILLSCLFSYVLPFIVPLMERENLSTSSEDEIIVLCMSVVLCMSIGRGIKLQLFYLEKLERRVCVKIGSF